MKCPKCGSKSNTPIKFKDGRSGARCNDCGCKMAVKKNVEAERPTVTQSEPITATVSTTSGIEEMSKSTQKNKSLVKDLKTWIKNPISIALVVIIGVLLIACILLVTISSNNNNSSYNSQTSSQNEASPQSNTTLDLTFNDLTAIAKVVGKKHNIEYKQIEYLNEPDAYSAGLYSLDIDVIRLSFSANSPTSKAKTIDLTINASEVTNENVEIFVDMLDWILKVLDEKAYLDGSSKIWKELSGDYESNMESMGIGAGYYETDKLSFSYHIIDGDMVISIFPK